MGGINSVLETFEQLAGEQKDIQDKLASAEREVE
jgi:hypothetical protein